ncbi:MAG: RSP_7527 family protein [Kiloniellaceae bacterium]
MMHQSQDLTNGARAGKTGILINGTAISGADIERHIAEGKRMQAEAIAGFLTGLFSRIGATFRRRADSGAETAMPHGA